MDCMHEREFILILRWQDSLRRNFINASMCMWIHRLEVIAINCAESMKIKLMET